MSKVRRRGENRMAKPGEWTKISEQSPPEPINKFGGDDYLVTVVNNQVVAANYIRTTVRGKSILRWEWSGRICPWDIIAWMPFPSPYIE